MANVAPIGSLNVFVSGTVISSSDVNSNFQDIKSAFNELVTGVNTLKIDQINSVVGTDVVVAGVTMDSGGITATSDIDTAGDLKADALKEHTTDNGVDVEDINFKDGKVQQARVPFTGQPYVERHDLGDKSSDPGSMVDWDNGNIQRFRMTASFTLDTPANPQEGAIYYLEIDRTGDFQVTWWATVEWGNSGAPAQSDASGEVDLIGFYYNGTKYLGVRAGLSYTP